MHVGGRIIVGTSGCTLHVVRDAGKGVAAPVAAARSGRIHERRERPLRALLIIRRQWDVAQAVLHTRILPERQLESVEHAEDGNARCQSEDSAEGHVGGTYS